MIDDGFFYSQRLHVSPMDGVSWRQVTSWEFEVKAVWTQNALGGERCPSLAGRSGWGRAPCQGFWEPESLGVSPHARQEDPSAGVVPADPWTLLGGPTAGGGGGRPTRPSTFLQGWPPTGEPGVLHFVSHGHSPVLVPGLP